VGKIPNLGFEKMKYLHIKVWIEVFRREVGKMVRGQGARTKESGFWPCTPAISKL
jgi:hypothetical protein